MGFQTNPVQQGAEHANFGLCWFNHT
jgi:hypothetical protein